MAPQSPERQAYIASKREEAESMGRMGLEEATERRNNAEFSKQNAAREADPTALKFARPHSKVHINRRGLFSNFLGFGAKNTEILPPQTQIKPTASAAERLTSPGQPKYDRLSSPDQQSMNLEQKGRRSSFESLSEEGFRNEFDEPWTGAQPKQEIPEHLRVNPRPQQRNPETTSVPSRRLKPRMYLFGSDASKPAPPSERKDRAKSRDNKAVIGEEFDLGIPVQNSKVNFEDGFVDLNMQPYRPRGKKTQNSPKNHRGG
jgi:hypothetical protein